MNQNNLIFVVYDGITNPVFQGQVLQPILNEMEKDSNLMVYLISFEKDSFEENNLTNHIPKKNNLVFIKFKRFPVIGKISLLHSVFLLKQFLKQFSSYSIKSRGPFAGWISLQAMDKTKCESFVVQARGLVAVEYEMFYSKKNKFKILHELRKKIFKKIESEIYNPKKLPSKFCIESVSPALSDYIINNYNAKREVIEIAKKDFPKRIDDYQKEIWRNKIRKELNIPENFHVYCYNGSSKPWQSLDMTIHFFKNELQKMENIFLLILTQDEATFAKLLNEASINTKYYKILNVKHVDIYQYLSACDTGLIFRKEHLANWISRPIKAMEYQAVGLKIVHNNTVKWLIDQGKDCI